jgi:hypothetical protein
MRRRVMIKYEKACPKSRIQLPTKFAMMLRKSINEKSGGNPLDLGRVDEHDNQASSSSDTLVADDGNEKEEVRKDRAKKGKKESKVKTFGLSELIGTIAIR